MTQPIDFEHYFKCLLVLNQNGIYLMGQDGHIWINSDSDREYNEIETALRDSGIVVNNKIYGGVFEAIDVMDEALKRCKHPSLIECYREWGDSVLFLGKGGFDKSRIDKVKPKNGGIF